MSYLLLSKSPLLLLSRRLGSNHKSALSRHSSIFCTTHTCDCSFFKKVWCASLVNSIVYCLYVNSLLLVKTIFSMSLLMPSKFKGFSHTQDFSHDVNDMLMLSPSHTTIITHQSRICCIKWFAHLKTIIDMFIKKEIFSRIILSHQQLLIHKKYKNILINIMPCQDFYDAKLLHMHSLSTHTSNHNQH